MSDDLRRPAVDPATLPPRRGSGYPEPFQTAVEGRIKRALGDAFGLTQFGINLVEMPPGCWSSQRHWHSHEDEFVYVVSGELVLVTDAGEQPMRKGMVAGFPAGRADGHHLINRSDAARRLSRDRHPHRRGWGGLFRHRHGSPAAPRRRPRLRPQEWRALLTWTGRNAGSPTMSRPPSPRRRPNRAEAYLPVVNTRLTGVGTSAMLPVGVSSPVF